MGPRGEQGLVGPMGPPGPQGPNGLSLPGEPVSSSTLLNSSTNHMEERVNHQYSGRWIYITLYHL